MSGEARRRTTRISSGLRLKYTQIELIDRIYMILYRKDHVNPVYQVDLRPILFFAYSSSRIGSSSAFLTACMKRAASAPSVTRWSAEIVAFIR